MKKKRFPIFRFIPDKIIRSLSSRVIFFTILALSVSSILAGGTLILIYVTDLKTLWDMTPTKIAIIALTLSWVSSAVISSLINRNILRPLNHLTEATRQIASGDFDIHLEHVVNPITRESELSTLVDGFHYMAAELKSTEMFRNDFIHNFSHEFKTPIISIRGFARQLYQGNLSPEQQQEFAKIIMDESEHLANMSANVLLMTKLENQNIVSERKPFSLDEQLRDCMLLFEEQWSAKNITISMNLEPITYNQNAELLSHIWTNLISNAIKFTGPDGRLHVSCSKNDVWVSVTVTDNGIGMDEETAKHVFEKFYQGDKSRSTPGNGLGLPLAKRIVDMTGGFIRLKTMPGVGTTFHISLPVTPPTEPSRSRKVIIEK